MGVLLSAHREVGKWMKLSDQENCKPYHSLEWAGAQIRNLTSLPGSKYIAQASNVKSCYGSLSQADREFY